VIEGLTVAVPVLAAAITHAHGLTPAGGEDPVVGTDDPFPNPDQPAVPGPIPQPGTSGPQAHECFRNGLIALGAIALFSGSCWDACSGANDIRHVPAIHGRVVDMETGQPLAGVRITRWFNRMGISGPGGGGDYRVERSLMTVTTGRDGRFTLPAWIGLLRGVSYVTWTEFKPGWVATRGGIDPYKAPWLSVFGSDIEPLIQVETDRENPRPAVTLRIRRVDAPEVAKIHFSAIEDLYSYRAFKAEDFVSEAVAYAKSHEMTEEILSRFSRLASHWDLGTNDEEGRPCHKARLAWTLLVAEEETCRKHPDWKTCRNDAVRERRKYLERHCAAFMR
jgi:hypothetical protein